MTLQQANGCAARLVLISVAVCLLLAAGLPLARAGRDHGEHQEGAEYAGGSGQAADEATQIGHAGDLLAGKQLGDILTSLMGNFLGAKQQQQGGPGGSGGSAYENNNNNNDNDNKNDNKKGAANKPGFEMNDWVKLMFNPVELVKAICQHFKLDFDKTSTAIGKPMVFGYESALTPLVVTAKIVEKVFVPDACKLLFVCKMGHHLEFIKVKVLKLNTKFLEGSQYLKAFSEGLVGRSCEEAFSGCSGGKPKLNKNYEAMRLRALSAPQSISGDASGALAGAATESVESQADDEPRAGPAKATKATVNRISALA